MVDASGALGRPPFPDGVIVLAGGEGRRLGYADKASLRVGSRSLLESVLAAACGRPTVVVGPGRELPAGALPAREDPPGGGPAAAVAAGFAVLRGVLPGRPEGAVDPALVAVLAVDQPGVTSATLARLALAVPRDRPACGAVLVAAGRRQYAAGVFAARALRDALRGRDSWHGVALRVLIDPLVCVEVPAVGTEADDVDTPQDLARWRAARPG